jgi:mRNA-degrading endonuclease RelE of RelBE toxin-antitoxin system
MEFESTPTFDRDVRKLDKHERQLLKELLEKIRQDPQIGKPMEHYSNVFSKRTGPRRLIYKVNLPERIIILILYENRDEAYETLRKMPEFD